MVAKIITGKSIKGAMNYNEKKVREGVAELLKAEGFPSDTLSFNAKLQWFRNLTELNRRTKTNAVHISLNFDPSEDISAEKLKEIADAYMEGIGFTGQPYLLYQHNDANHPHVHLVTTNIKRDKKRIPTHYIGANRSEKVRKEIEKAFGLVPAEGREHKQEESLKTVSSIVASVVREYKFTSLAELNAVLNERNITAYRGEPDTEMFKKNGLVYYALDAKGERKGVPVKASAVYSKPTLKNLEKRFAKNKASRLAHKKALKDAIEETLLSGFIANKEALQAQLAKRNIAVIYRENETMVYGITFIDHNNKTVFNGSDIDKSYSAKNILERIGVNGLAALQERKNNKDFVEQTLSKTDYTKGVPESLAAWYENGMRIQSTVDNEGNIRYAFGHYKTKDYNFLEADKKFDAWLKNNDISPFIVNRMNGATEKYLNQPLPVMSLAQHLSQQIHDLLATVPDMPSAAGSFVPKKKKKRKPNW